MKIKLQPIPSENLLIELENKLTTNWKEAGKKWLKENQQELFTKKEESRTSPVEGIPSTLIKKMK